MVLEVKKCGKMFTKLIFMSNPLSMVLIKIFYNIQTKLVPFKSVTLLMFRFYSCDITYIFKTSLRKKYNY